VIQLFKDATHLPCGQVFTHLVAWHCVLGQHCGKGFHLSHLMQMMDG
jgi:hypothetical protein